MRMLIHGIKSLIRRPAKTAMLLIILFIVFNLIFIGFIIQNSVQQSKAYIRSQIGGAVEYKMDFTAYMAAMEKSRSSSTTANSSANALRPPSLSLKVAETIAKSPYVKSFYITESANVNSTTATPAETQITGFVGKTKIDVLNWQSDVNSKFANIKVVFTDAYGEKGSVGKIVSQTVQNDYINTGSTVTFALSKGMKIVMPDFAGKTETECKTIANSNGMDILFDYQDNATISKGFVISQSVPENTVITDADIITIVISIKA